MQSPKAYRKQCGFVAWLSCNRNKLLSIVPSQKQAGLRSFNGNWCVQKTGRGPQIIPYLALLLPSVKFHSQKCFLSTFLVSPLSLCSQPKVIDTGKTIADCGRLQWIPCHLCFYNPQICVVERACAKQGVVACCVFSRTLDSPSIKRRRRKPRLERRWTRFNSTSVLLLVVTDPLGWR